MGANDGAILQIWQEAAGDDQLWTISEVKDRTKRAPAKKAEEPAVDAAPAVESAPAEEAKPEVKAEPVVEEKPVEEPAKAEEKPAEPVKAEEVKAEPVKAAAPAAKAPAKKPAAKKTSRAAAKGRCRTGRRCPCPALLRAERSLCGVQHRREPCQHPLHLRHPRRLLEG